MSKLVSNVTIPNEAFLWYAAGIIDGEGNKWGKLSPICFFKTFSV